MSNSQYHQGFQDALSDIASKIRDFGVDTAVEYLLDNACDLTDEQRRAVAEAVAR